MQREWRARHTLGIKSEVPRAKPAEPRAAAAAAVGVDVDGPARAMPTFARAASASALSFE